MLPIILRLTAFLAGAWVSYEYVEEYYVVGPVFGAVVLIWDYAARKRAEILKFLGFFASSAAIYALVIWTDRQAWVPGDGIFEYLYPPVILGTVLLPLAHRIFLSVSSKRVWVSIPLIYALSWGSGLLLDAIDLPTPLQSWVNTVSVWQAAYLILIIPLTSKQGTA